MMNNPMNSTVRKIHNLLSSGAVTVTGPNQPRILKQKIGGSNAVAANNNNSNNTVVQQNNYGDSRCYVCDDSMANSTSTHQLTEMHTSHTNTKFPNKIGQLVGDAFMVIVSVDDVVCSRCTNLVNYLDRLENDVERVRTNIINLLHKKYGLNDDGGAVSGSQSGTPPTKMQKLAGNVAALNPVANNSDERVRKTALLQHDSTQAKPPVSAVQQIKISTQQSQQQQQTSSQTQTIQRKTTKIYKCLSCDYKTSDMRLFNTHYESCKQQNFQCKNCKKIFPNFGAMKHHMIKDHNTPMDNTCAVCHINFVSEQALRKHMEINHSTNVVVTSSATIPAATAAAAAAADNISHQSTTNAASSSTPLYTCNHCPFKSTDKPIFDEHLRKHMPGNKPKPFKCRLCSQRFETREQATVHAKQHQPNYFKCGTCSVSFPKREMLVKHFEVHQQQQQQQQPTQKLQSTTTTLQQQQQQQPTTISNNNNLLTTQKLLQETIDEALSDSVLPPHSATAEVVTGGSGGGGGAANANIRFFSCHICSLTFIQENYYNQHMETHKREKKNAAAIATAGNTLSTSSSIGSLSSSSGLLSEGLTTNNTNIKSGAKADSRLGSVKTSVGGGGTMQRSSSSASTAISEADIESIFEKMHSDKGDTGGGGSGSSNDNAANITGGSDMVITSQAGTGGITFNITIPQSSAAAAEGENKSNVSSKSITTATNAANVSIDMPMLDQADETPTVISEKLTRSEGGGVASNDGGGDVNAASAAAKLSALPVSMPSLDDDNDCQESREQQIVAAKTQSEKDSLIGSKAKDPNDSTTKEAIDDTSVTANEDDSMMSVEQQQQHEQQQTVNAADQQQQQVTMELDEAMQAQVEGGQIKFILNENGQLLQLDNHIITDADGNQILVQDPEQIQQLLQSVGVLQGGEGLDGETLQMMTDANGQMVLVQGDNNETQLIDASLLNADGQLVIQQGGDGELGEGAHVIGEDGTRIPVSVSYTADGQPIVQVQQQILETTTDAQQMLALEKESAAEDAGAVENAQASDAATGSGGGSGGFFALEDLMQQSADADNAKDAD